MNNSTIFNKLSSIYAATLDNNKRYQLKLKALLIPDAIKLLKSPEYSQSYDAFINDMYIYRGDNSISIHAAEVIPGKRKSENTYNVYTRLFSDVLSSWKKYPKRNRSFICSTNFVYANSYVNSNSKVYCMLPKNDVCSSDDIWGSFPMLREYDIRSLSNFVSDFIRLLTLFINMDRTDTVNIFDYGSTQKVKSLLNDIECAIKKYDGNDDWINSNLEADQFNSYIVTTLRNNPDLSLISLLDKSLLNPVANKFKLLNNITELSTVGQDSREVWFSGQCIMVSSEIINMIKKQLKD